MDNWSVGEWAVFTIAGVWALMKNLALREHYRHHNFPDLRANARALVQLASFVAIGAEGYSPVHLIWLFPLSFLSALLALRITFCTWIVWLYGFMIANTVTLLAASDGDDREALVFSFLPRPPCGSGAAWEQAPSCGLGCSRPRICGRLKSPTEQP